MKLPRLGFLLATILAIALTGCNQAPAAPSATTAPKSQATQPVAAPTATGVKATVAVTPQTAQATTASATKPATAAAKTTPAASTDDPFAFYLQYLSAADVEKVTGLTGIKRVPQDPSKGAGGFLNFAKSDGSMIVIATFGDASLYTQSKAYKGMYKADVSGVGDEAFSGPSENLFGGGAWTSDPYLIVARKGAKSFSVTSSLDYTGSGKPILTKDQLTALAKLVASKM